MNLPFKKTREKLLTGDISRFLKTSTEKNISFRLNQPIFVCSYIRSLRSIFQLEWPWGTMLSGAVIPAVLKRSKIIWPTFPTSIVAPPANVPDLLFIFPWQRFI
ncbi:MAG: hypothetical protein JWM28_998 [Chitinophagaceae bacterium]|nr:hypothetical protein [Chitinophagaceae bacterium]